MRTQRTGQSVVMMAVMLLATGCVLKRGDDFGSYVGRSETVPIIRVYNVSAGKAPPASTTVMILPPLGDIKSPYSESLQQDIQEELQKYLNARVVTASPKGKLSEYVTEENLAPESGFFDFGEIARLGSLLGVDYMFCTWVSDWRPYPPQTLSLYLVLLETKNGSVLAELDAVFEASEQRVHVALENYLQRRVSRPYDKQNFNVLLESPTAYRHFVVAECCRAMAFELVSDITY
ncbi:MAG: hypothetical protein EOL87_16530 [Spartobacteria bacterium]|nr:hypothetical protein [Spartobacteria bacterium]